MSPGKNFIAALHSLLSTIETAMAARSITLIALAMVGGAACTESVQDGASSEIEILKVGAHVEPCARLSTSDRKEQFREYNAFACRLVAVPTGFAIGPSADGTTPDADPRISTKVVRDSRGRVYTSSAHGDPILVWDSSGRYLAKIGRRGGGPGEFADYGLSLFIDVGDSLHVLDSRGRWQVFDSTFKYVRSFRAARDFGSVTLIPDGPIAFGSAKSWGIPNAMLGFMSRDGAPIGSVGSTTDAELIGRPISAAPDGTVWLAPVQGDTTGYVLENWATDRTLRRTIRRDVPWLTAGGYSDEPRLPSFRMLHVDGDGLIWVAVSVKDSRWYPRKPGQSLKEYDRDIATLYDLRVEVIDPKSGIVLASVRFDTGDRTALPPIYPVGQFTRLFWGTNTDSLGQGTLTMYELKLAKNDDKQRSSATAIRSDEARTKTNARPVVEWSSTDIRTLVATKQYSVVQLANAPQLIADIKRERLIGPILGVTPNNLNAARALSGGRTVVQMDDRKTLVFTDSLGQEYAPRFHHDAYTLERIVVGHADTVYLAVGSSGRSGTDFVLRIHSGRKIDSLASPLRTLRGVRSDGALMYWHISSRQPRGYSEEDILSPDANVTILSASPTAPVVIAEIRIPFETQFNEELPWSKFARGAESGGTVWISPVSGPELIRVATSGLPDLRLRWETVDSIVSAYELSGLKNYLARQIPKSLNESTRKQKLTAINTLTPTSRANAIDRIIGGHDGSIWVRNRRPRFGVQEPDVVWLGFRANGDLIGTLRLPFDMRVHELTENEALLERSNPFALIRVPLIQSSIKH